MGLTRASSKFAGIVSAMGSQVKCSDKFIRFVVSHDAVYCFVHLFNAGLRCSKTLIASMTFNTFCGRRDLVALTLLHIHMLCGDGGGGGGAKSAWCGGRK